MANVSTIGRGTVVRGSVRGDGDLDIQGRVEGSVVVEGELTIGESALIKSDVSARRVVVRGAVAGNVSADESVVLESGARVVGDLGAPQIGIRPGALLRGNVSTQVGGQGAGARPRAAAATARAARPKPVERPVAAAPKPAAKTDGLAAKTANGPRVEGNARKPPPPVVPSLKRGAKGALKRKGAR